MRTALRALLVALLAFWTARLGSGAQQGCFLDLVNLAFHEAGHLFLAPFGQTMHFLGGTLGQLAVPAGLVVYFLLVRRDPFAAAASAWWVGENLADIAVYMADARDLALPLVGGGDHDWNNLFYTFGLLGQDSVAAVSSWTHRVGTLVMVASLVWLATFLLTGESRRRFEVLVEQRLPALRPLVSAE
ncbi:MAG TPA: hypothetical protein VGS03_04625 [Candidatus Polarisedimenticolia bacterium]|jgi:hypothetical protein|nr:hypothetical protein [Candidatus Polarisedimenticolia bacterium]